MKDPTVPTMLGLVMSGKPYNEALKILRSERKKSRQTDPGSGGPSHHGMF